MQVDLVLLMQVFAWLAMRSPKPAGHHFEELPDLRPALAPLLIPLS